MEMGGMCMLVGAHSSEGAWNSNSGAVTSIDLGSWEVSRISRLVRTRHMTTRTQDHANASSIGHSIEKSLSVVRHMKNHSRHNRWRPPNPFNARKLQFRIPIVIWDVLQIDAAHVPRAHVAVAMYVRLFIRSLSSSLSRWHNFVRAARILVV